ncbi:MAG: DNA internalization-related competence protein ComEC/Rec2, partial [Nitrospirota bacterium]|nr:DNA internalization-related competence protein ComEC/Rec2 [Nitrospirota bacterium]MDX2420223.1 DNA internalization-related competence protein ComEC/Rec2 [Nitrospirota bacterium]
MILHGVVAYLAGVWLGPFLSLFPLSVLGALLSFGLLLTFLEQRGSLSRWGGLFLFAVVVAGIGQAHWAAMGKIESPLLALSHEHPVKLQGVIVAPVRYTPDGVILLVEVQHSMSPGKTQPIHGRIRLTWREPTETVVYGNHVSFTARVREPFGTLNPGGFHYGNYLKRKGIQAVATVYGPNGVTRLSQGQANLWGSVMGRVDQWRQAIHHAATTSLSPPALGLFLGMIIGEQSFIEQDIRDAFMASGTVHILSISGSHLGLLALVVFAGARWCIRRLPASWLERLSIYLTATQFSVLMTLPIVSFYMLLAGAEMATVRSWIMIVVCCLGIWLGRERNLVTALAIAALLMILPHPEAIHDISFQLSYLSVAAIGMVLLARKTEDPDGLGVQVAVSREASSWSVSFWEKGTLALLMTLAVSLTTLPLVAYYFHQIPWLGLVTNMVIVPLVGILVIPLGLLAGVGVLLSGAETLPLGMVNQWVFDLCAQVVVGLSKVPGAEWYVASPSIGSIFLFWCVLAGLVLLRHRPIVRWGCLTMLVGILVWWAWSPRTEWTPGMLRVTFLDVGQGDATLLELPDGQTVLIDGGPAYRRLDMGRAVIGPYLWNRGIHRIDHVIATHPQWDHVGGLPWVLQAFDVGTYWSNGISRSRAFFKRLQTAVDTADVDEQVGVAGSDIIGSGPCSLSVLSPSAKESSLKLVSTQEISGKDLNNRSLVTRLDCGAHSLLFTADAEQEVLEQLQRLPHGHSAKIVKVPHHGAKSSLHDGWINQIEAEAMVVSVGSHNRYGHPAEEV